MYNNHSIEQHISAAVNRLRKKDFPGMGQDATVWIRWDGGGGRPPGYIDIEILPAGTGGLPLTCPVLNLCNLWDDDRTLREYKQMILNYLPEIITQIRAQGYVE